jgi:adenylate cyclase, class 2
LLNYKDYTIKARLRDPGQAEEILMSLNARFVGLDLQTDYYFATDKGKLKYRHGTIENLITHYERQVVEGIEKTTVYRYDLNPTPDQISQLSAERQLIGMTTKERKIYTIDHIKIHLDKLPDGQCYIEIEAIDRNNRFSDHDLKNQCLAMKATLKIPDADMMTTGYLK